MQKKQVTTNTSTTDAVLIEEIQVSFPVKGAPSFHATRRQFPLSLAWAVTIHKYQGLTLPEIVVDMSPEKGNLCTKIRHM